MWHKYTLAVPKLNLPNIGIFLKKSSGTTCKNNKYLLRQGLDKVAFDRVRVVDAKLVR